MQTMIGIFETREDANRAIAKLIDNGFNPRNISVIVKDSENTNSLKGQKGGMATANGLKGAATGGIIGGLAGILIGIGAIAIPGIGAILIGGPFATALGLSGVAATAISAVTTGAVTGGLLGVLTGIGLPNDVARTYESRIRQGAVLLAVPVSSQRENYAVEKVFDQYNADQIREVDDTGTSGIAYPSRE